jgi:hypothetical protein
MIEQQLLNILVEKNILKSKVEVEACYKGRDLSGNPTLPMSGVFLIVEVHKVEDSYDFTCASDIDGSQRLIRGRDIYRIDGMCPKRFALVFGLNAEGERIKYGKRRGRKPKIPRPEEVGFG